MDAVMSLPFPSCLPAITVISSPVCRISSLICKVLSPVLRRNSYSILCFIASSDVLRAISKLKLHKDDGDLGLPLDGGTGISGLTRGFATFSQGGSRSLRWSEIRMEDPKRTLWQCTASVCVGECTAGRSPWGKQIQGT